MIDNSLPISTWPISGWENFNGWSYDNDNWYYFVNSSKQSGWIYDKGKWHYCYSTGEMAHDTSIDGYYLSSNGAWIN